MRYIGLVPETNTSTVSPEGAKALLDAGYTVRVEKCPNRIYKIDEYAAAGAEIVETGSWVKAPKEDVILGLKELEADGSKFESLLTLDFHGKFVFGLLFELCSNNGVSPPPSQLHSLCARLQEAARMGY